MIMIERWGSGAPVQVLFLCRLYEQLYLSNYQLLVQELSRTVIGLDIKLRMSVVPMNNEI